MPISLLCTSKYLGCRWGGGAKPSQLLRLTVLHYNLQLLLCDTIDLLHSLHVYFHPSTPTLIYALDKTVSCQLLLQVDITDNYQSSIQVSWNQGILTMSTISLLITSYKYPSPPTHTHPSYPQRCHPICAQLMSMNTSFPPPTPTLMETLQYKPFPHSTSQ